MKKLSVVLVALIFMPLSSMAAPKVSIVLASGGMGTDGATLESMPTENSVADAAAIYRALKVKANADGDKVVGVEFDGDIVGLKCEKPGSGIHTQTAGCEYMTIVKEVPPSNGLSIDMNGSIELAPKISEMVYKSLGEADSSRVGAITKEAGNLRCTLAVRPGAKPTCVLKGVTVTKAALNQFSKEEQVALKKLALELGL